MKHLKYLSLLSVLILPFLVQDADATTFASPVNATITNNVNSNLQTSGQFGYSVTDESNTLYYVWVEIVPDPVELWFATMDSSGTVSTAVQVDTINTSGFGYNYGDVFIIVNGATIDVFYQENVGSSDIQWFHKRSTDTGATWGSQNNISSGDNFNGVNMKVDGSNIYFVGQFPFIESGVQPDGDDEIYLLESNNGGTTFATKKLLSDVTDAVDGDTFRPNIVVDGSNIYVSYEALDIVNLNTKQWFTKSTDGGTSFTTPIRVSHISSETDQNWFKPNLLINPLVTTELVMIYEDHQTEDQIVIARSTDSGSTWSSQSQVMADSECTSNTAFLNDKGVLQDDDTIYTFCNDPVGGTETIKIFKSTDFGATFDSGTLLPTVETIYFANSGISDIDGNTITLAYQTNTGVTASNYMYTESVDGGSSWATPTVILTDTHLNFIEESDLTKTPTSIFLTIHQEPNQNFNVRIGTAPQEPTTFSAPFNISQTGSVGSVWELNQNIDKYKSGSSSVFVDGTTSHFLWSDQNAGEDTILYGNNIAGTQSVPVQIDITSGGFGYEFWQSMIQASGSTVDVLYVKETGGGGNPQEVFHSRSTDTGATWSTPTSIQGLPETSHKQFLKVNGNNIAIIYYDDTTNTFKSVASTNGGTTFSAEALVTDPPEAEIQNWVQDAILDGSNLHLIYLVNDINNSINGRYLYYTNSTDYGASWSAETQVFDSGLNDLVTSASFYYHPTDPTNFIVVASERDSVSFETLYSIESNNSGTTWTPTVIADQNDACNGAMDDMSHRNFGFDGFGNTIVGSCSIGGTFLNVISTQDFGTSWSTLSSITTVEDDLVNTGDKSMFVQDEDYVVNLIQETRSGGGFEDDWYVQESFDGGLTWTGASAIAIHNDKFSSSNDPRLAVANNVVHVQYGEGSDLFTVRGDVSVNGDPVLTLIGSANPTLAQDTPYVELGATCLDPEDGQIDGNVVIGGQTVLHTIVGSYNVTYDCTDSQSGTATQLIRTVTVTDQTIPVITLLGDDPQNILIDTTFQEFGATCLDNNDGQINQQVVISGDTVTTATVGTFTILYDCGDLSPAFNEAVQVSRTVNVVAELTTTTTSGGSGGSSVPTTPSTGGTGSLDDLSQSEIDELLGQLAPSQETTIIQEIIQTFFEFEVLDKTHEDLVINSFLSDEALGIRWSTGDDIIISSIRPADSPFDFSFEQVPIIKKGSGSAISENSLIYNLDVPETQCSVEFGFDCVEKIRYSIPVTVDAIINGTDVTNTGTILVDLTEEQLNPILLILLGTIAIPIVAGIIWKAKGGHNPTKVKDLLQ